MKTILLFIVMLLPLVSTAQPMFGYSPSEIREKHPDVKWVYEKWGEEKDKMVMRYQQDNLEYNYFFNENNESIFTCIGPKTQGLLQNMIEVYNNRYVIISKNEWRFYKDGLIYNAKLKLMGDNEYYFVWSIE